MASIYIATTTIPDWQGNAASVELRVLTDAPFVAASGTIHPQTVSNAANIGTFYQVFPCTEGVETVVIPAITLDSTTDSPDNPSATYTAVLWDKTQAKLVQALGTFALPATPTSTTWAALIG